jgi:thioredoxin reductase
MTYDVVVVGTGPAGLSAVLTLGRARRSTLLIDGGPGRNAHNFLTRDGIAPAELRDIALEQLAEYPRVQIRAASADRAQAVDGEFDLALAGGDRVRTRRLLLATGVLDELPAVPGLAERWGAVSCTVRTAMAGSAGIYRWRCWCSTTMACARRSTCAGSAPMWSYA